MLTTEQNIVINNIEYNLDTMTPVMEEKSDSNNNVNENRIIIISNVDILAAGVGNGGSPNIPGIDPSHMFNTPGTMEKYNQNSVPKLVPITKRAYNHNNGVDLSNGAENEANTDEEHEKSPKVFIIEKSGGESDALTVPIETVSNVSLFGIFLIYNFN